MPKPKISIITPTHNRPKLLERAIESVLNQTMTDWEMIIIDDSTNNETQEFIKKYQNHPQIIYLKNEKNKGLPFSRNRGLDTAEGNWINFLDDDDFFVSNQALENVSLVLKGKDNWIICNTVDPMGNPRTKALMEKDSYNWTKDLLFGRNFRGDAAHFMEKEFIGDIRYNEYNQAEWFFWYKLAKKDNFIYYPISVTQVEYLSNGLSRTGTLKKERTAYKQQFLEMLKSISTWKYLPIIIARYIISFSFPRKIFVWFKQRRAS